MYLEQKAYALVKQYAAEQLRIVQQNSKRPACYADRCVAGFVQCQFHGSNSATRLIL
jgi:hypothetical protein